MANNMCKVVTGVVLILEKDNKILLFKRNMPNKIAYGKFCLPGGTVEHNESIIQTVSREAYEEIGIVINPCDVQIVHLQRLREKYDLVSQVTEQILMLYFAVITFWKGEPKNLEPEKHSDLGWFDKDALPQNMFEYNVLGLNDIKSSIPFSEYGWQVVYNQAVTEEVVSEKIL